MSSLARGTCPACGRDVALRRNGETREHRRPAEKGTGRICHGRRDVEPETTPQHERHFSARIEIGNAAFCPEWRPEVARILRALAEELDAGCCPRFLMDANGNTAGAVDVRE